MVDLEQPLGGNMRKVLNLSALNCQNTQGISTDKVLLSEPHLIIMNRKAGKRAKQACPSNTGKTRPPCNTRLLDFFVPQSH